MKMVIFGLTVSSSWGNGHATIWRALCGELARAGHQIKFFERDVSYYAQHRDLQKAEGYQLLLYRYWDEITAQAEIAVGDSDAVVVTSYCPDARAASEMILQVNGPVRIFYDLDTPVTLGRLRSGEEVDYIPVGGLSPFDLVLSYTGGRALQELRDRLGAKRVVPLYGTVDANVYQPVQHDAHFESDLSYLGTYASDRQPILEELFVKPARRCPGKKFVIGGAQYPEEFPWTENMWFVRHVPPPEHPAFYSSSRLTLNVTRAAMADMGFCPSGRLFEAAACGTPVISDWWDGLDEFFDPGNEIFIATTSEGVQEVLMKDPEELRHVADAARSRVRSEHTAQRRCNELLERIQEAA
ncbi:MAG: glycosyltransferase [Acidobacteria bacterium]|jgi:spore maturation protein CgeB|nr:MAG: glycosyltransferase [Acidobacteriota bacterium]